MAKPKLIPANTGISFEERIPVIQFEIAKRRSKWRLTTVEFEDASQMIILRVFNKYHTYIPERGEFTHWLNTVISSTIKNIFRDHLLKFNRPCINGCNYNLGDEFCSYTKSGKQCSECPLYRKWEIRKKDHFNIKQSLPLENHSQEVNNMPQDSLDIQHCKNVIDKKIKVKLKPYEYQIYRMLYIDHMTLQEVGTKLKYKKSANSEVPGYQQLKKIEKKIIQASREIIEQEGLA